MSDVLSQSRLKRETRSDDPNEQAAFLRRNYGIHIVPAGDGRLYLPKEVYYRAMLARPESNDGIVLNLHAAQKKTG